LKVSRLIALTRTGALEIRSPVFGNPILSSDWLLLVHDGIIDAEDDIDVEITAIDSHEPRMSHVAVPEGVDVDAVTDLCNELGLEWPVEIRWDEELNGSGRHRHHEGEQAHYITLHPEANPTWTNRTLLHELGHALDCEVRTQAFGEDWHERTRSAHDDVESVAWAAADRLESRWLLTERNR
jgi:hypothetical protein